jgi:hypothetical protein
MLARVYDAECGHAKYERIEENYLPPDNSCAGDGRPKRPPEAPSAIRSSSLLAWFIVRPLLVFENFRLSLSSGLGVGPSSLRSFSLPCVPTAVVRGTVPDSNCAGDGLLKRLPPGVGASSLRSSSLPCVPAAVVRCTAPDSNCAGDGLPKRLPPSDGGLVGSNRVSLDAGGGGRGESNESSAPRLSLSGGLGVGPSSLRSFSLPCLPTAVVRCTVPDSNCAGDGLPKRLPPSDGGLVGSNRVWLDAEGGGRGGSNLSAAPDFTLGVPRVCRACAIASCQWPSSSVRYNTATT